MWRAFVDDMARSPRLSPLGFDLAPEADGVSQIWLSPDARSRLQVPKTHGFAFLRESGPVRHADGPTTRRYLVIGYGNVIDVP